MTFERILSEVEKRPFTVLIAVVVAARMSFWTSSAISLDDLKYLQSLPPKELLLSQGRVGWLLLERALAKFGLVGPYWGSHALIVALGMQCAAAWIFARIGIGRDGKERLTTTLLCAMLFCLHPYHAEILTFREAFPFYATALLLSALAIRVLIRGSNRFHFLGGLILLVSALTIQQIVLNIVVITLLVRCMQNASFTRMLSSGERRAWLGVVLSVVVYGLLVHTLNLAVDVEFEGRGRIMALGEVLPRFVEWMRVMSALIHFDLFVSAPWLSWLVGALTAIGLSKLMFDTPSVSLVAIRVLLLCLAMLSVIGVAGVGHVFWPAPRTLVGFALLSSMFIAVGYGHILQYRAYLPLVGIALAGYTAIGNTIAMDQDRTSTRDRLTATVMANQIATQGTTRIAFVGEWRHGEGIRTRVGDMSLSAFAIPWSREPALVEFTGWDWTVVDTIEPEWEKHCATTRRWPSGDSVYLDGQIAVICL